LVGRSKPAAESAVTTNQVKRQPDEKSIDRQKDAYSHENMATDVDAFIEEKVESTSQSSVNSRPSFACSKQSEKSQSKLSVKPDLNEDQAKDKEMDFDVRSADGPPAEVSLDLSDAGSVVSILSRQFGDIASVSSFSSKRAKKDIDTNKMEEHYVAPLGLSDPNGEKDNETRSFSSKNSKQSMRSATSNKSNKSVSPKKSVGSPKKLNEKHVHKKSTDCPGMKLAPTPKSGMPPLYPTKQPSRTTNSSNINDYEEDDTYEQNENDVPHDDEFLEGRSVVSVAMVHHNEQGEFDIETIVEPNNNDAVVPLTMSI